MNNMRLRVGFSFVTVSVLVGCVGRVDDQENVDETEQEVVWNGDSLVEWFSLSTVQKTSANSVALITLPGKLTGCNTSFCTLSTSQTMCAGERYASQ